VTHWAGELRRWGPCMLGHLTLANVFYSGVMWLRFLSFRAAQIGGGAGPHAFRSCTTLGVPNCAFLDFVEIRSSRFSAACGIPTKCSFEIHPQQGLAHSILAYLVLHGRPSISAHLSVLLVAESRLIHRHILLPIPPCASAAS
jgi:hypothetical protein